MNRTPETKIKENIAQVTQFRCALVITLTRGFVHKSGFSYSNVCQNRPERFSDSGGDDGLGAYCPATLQRKGSRGRPPFRPGVDRCARGLSPNRAYILSSIFTHFCPINGFNFFLSFKICFFNLNESTIIRNSAENGAWGGINNKKIKKLPSRGCTHRERACRALIWSVIWSVI